MSLSLLDDLERCVDGLIALMDETGEPYWHRRLQMAQRGIRANRLGGVSQILGLFGGEDTFSDLELLEGLAVLDAERHAVVNERLERLRGEAWRLADTISNATARGPGEGSGQGSG